MKNFMKYLLIMIIPLAVLLSRPVIPLITLEYGQEVKLSTVPVDPRDIFRGDHVVLRFAIEEVDQEVVSPGLLSKINDKERYMGEDIKVYVTLKPDDKGIYRAILVSDKSPVDDIYVRGVIENNSRRGDIVINYGNNLSRFYVKENTGLELEEAARKGQVLAVAKVWKGFIVLDTIEKQITN